MTLNNGGFDRAKLNNWLSARYKTNWLSARYKILEYGRGYCDFDLWDVQRQGRQRVILFCDEYGYTYRQNDKANRFLIYNFNREEVRDKFPELCSYY